MLLRRVRRHVLDDPRAWLVRTAEIAVRQRHDVIIQVRALVTDPEFGQAFGALATR